MSTPESRRADRNTDARAAAAKRARELDAAEKLIAEERMALTAELQTLHARELDPELRAVEVPELRRQIQALAYRLYRPPFNMDGPTLAKIVGRSKQKLQWWFKDKPWLRTGEDSEDPAPGQGSPERSEQPTPPQPQ